VDASRAEPPPFAPARATRLADTVADQIRESILSGRLADGERLAPLERMTSQFGVSMPTMREALRTLEAEGLLSVKRGGIGGSLVHRPTPRTAAYTLALVLRSQGTRKRDVGEATQLLSPLCAGLCARRPDRAQAVVPELRRLNETARELLEADGVAYNASMLAFHDAVVRLSGNDTIAMVLRVLEHILLADVESWVADAAAHGEYLAPAGRRTEIATHDRIVDLIEEGDEDGAAALMKEHLARLTIGPIFDAEQRVDPKSVR
jgi:GntR family transcriptional repressor for pyruvate dehydrogenase complex